LSWSAYLLLLVHTFIMSEAQEHDDDKINRETEHPSDTQQQARNHDMDIGSMIQEAQEKGVKGALLSRLKKAKVGKVNLDPAIGEVILLHILKIVLINQISKSHVMDPLRSSRMRPWTKRE